MKATATNQTRLVIAGATGMVGGYALRYALDHPAVCRVTAIGRRSLARDLNRRLNLRETAVHKQFRSRDVAAVVGCEEDDGSGSLVWGSKPSERNAFCYHLLAFLAYL